MSTKAPGDLVHVDIKKLGRIPDGGGHRFLGRAAGVRVKKGAKPGTAYTHHAMDDHSRLVYSEILADECKETASAFWTRANRALFFRRRRSNGDPLDATRYGQDLRQQGSNRLALRRVIGADRDGDKDITLMFARPGGRGGEVLGWAVLTALKEPRRRAAEGMRAR